MEVKVLQDQQILGERIMTVNDDSSNRVLELVMPIWKNVEKVQTALGFYEGIGQYAKEINEKGRGHFFGYCQQHALDAAVLGICKMYETRRDVHGLKLLAKHLNDNFRIAKPRNVDSKLLGLLGLSEFENSLYAINTSALSEDLVTKCIGRMPTQENDDSLKKLFQYRNGYAAHQAVNNNESKLPPIEEMERLNNWAKGLCELIVDCFSGNIALGDSCKSGRMAVLNVIKKALDKNFNDPSKTVYENWQDELKFYKCPS